MNPARNNAVQIVLNSQDFVSNQPRPPGGGRKDFFEGDDQAFVAHKRKISGRLERIQSALASSPWGGTEYLRVKLRPEAWAKSHRPTGRLFSPKVCQSVGADAIGEPIFEVTEQSLVAALDGVRRSEDVLSYRTDKKGKRVPKPTAARSETGAIEDLALVRASDKQRFSAEDAEAWFKEKGAAPFYVVDLFALPRDAAEAARYPAGRKRLLDTFEAGLNEFAGIAVRRSRLAGGRGHQYLFVKLVSGQNRVLDADIYAEADKAWSSLPVERDLGRHAVLLKFLSQHPLVRRIHLPPIVRQHLQSAPAPMDRAIELPKPGRNGRWPKIGVVDGGVASVLQPWKIGGEQLIAPEHQSLGHGTFIAGLLVAGRAAGNTDEVARELDGCLIYDINIFPDSSNPHAFEQYHPNGFYDFLIALDSAVESAKAQQGVRVFNLSINVVLEVDTDKYSVFAELLDGIAQKHDVIIVVSAGNLEPRKMRTPWPREKDAVLKYLVKRPTFDRILQPGESVCAMTVTAVNPPGLAQHPTGAPTIYTRRGPGMDVGVKPDFTHYSGASADLVNGHGLYSIDENGRVVTNMGTSFAAPLVAKTLASLESQIAGYVPRETLVALMVHHARTPEALDARDLRDVARHFVGFGIPSGSREMLATPDSAITMVFNGSIGAGQWLEFPFNWPQCLVNPTGGCAVDVDMTLVYRPFIDPAFAAEFIRVNLNARLMQHDAEKGTWHGELKQLFAGKSDEPHPTERDLIAHGLKWWPIKHFVGRGKKSVGNSSSWRLRVEALVRNGEPFPQDGVPFSVVLTIRDPDGQRPVFREMRQFLTAHRVNCGDITAGVQIRTRPQGNS